MAWDVEVTDEFTAWWNDLTADEQAAITYVVERLMEAGPSLRHPYSSEIRQSRHGHMRELRAQYQGKPYRVLYAFDPRRSAILLIGGRKTSDERWYDEHVPKADALYDEHIATLRKEGLT